MLGWLALLLALLTATLFARAALASFSWSRLERLLADRKELLGRIFKNHEDVAAAVRVWFWLLVAVLVVLLAVANSGEGPRWLVLDERFLLLWIGFLLFELCITRPLARAFGERLLIACWPALDLLRLSLNPMIALEKYAESVLQKMTGTGGEEKSTAIQEEIKSVVNEGRREGSIRLENAEDMIEGLIELHTVKVADVMTPRTQMVMLKATDSVEHARQIVGDQGHSRIPVHGDNRDEIIGILYAKDLLPHLGPVTDGPAPLSSLKLRQPIFVPESKPVDALLKEFQRGRVHIAIVLDE
ncbi:MAG TPA: CBS domain-containing protein, partial [Planctomycetia bacterium]|nr:CBS domain-containing protein [Planctomycetia bacterium]